MVTKLKTSRLAWGLAALLAICPAAAWGWSDGGHEIVAAIAYSRLNSRAKAEVDRLLAVPVSPAGRPEPSDPAQRFMHAAHWADDVKRILPETADEHFIDQPFSPDGTPLPADLPKSDNILVALRWYVLALQIGSNDSEKARALRFVIHLVGDIHQPLHGSTRVTRALPEGDRGGNDFMVNVRDPNGGTHPVKLHIYWDGGLGTFPNGGPNFSPPPDGEIPPAMATVLHGHPSSDAQIAAGGPFNYQGWAAESKDLGIHIAYDDLPPNGTVSRSYQEAGVEVARRRVAWAGYRLANLLDAIWAGR
jgi:S1/P1 nuclease